MHLRSFLAPAAIVLAVGLAAAGLAFAGDEAPAKKPAPVTTEAPATGTPSPVHSILKWVGSQVMKGEAACPSTPAGEKAWRAWFSAKDAPLAGLRAALVQDGWTADRTIGFFKKMAAQKSCSDCKGGCDKAKGAAAPAGDAGKAGDAGSPCSKCKGGCNKGKGAAAPAGDAGKAGDAGSSCGKCNGGCNKGKGGAPVCVDGGCDKKGKCGKCKGDCNGAKGAAAPAGDAGKSGDAAPVCPCTGKPRKDCQGCGKASCPCGKDKPATAK